MGGAFDLRFEKLTRSDPSARPMPGWVYPALAAGATIGGSVLQYKLAKKAADSSHQREVVDLKKAGLNPLLSAMGGSGAPQFSLPDMGDAASKSVASAMALQQLKFARSQTEKTDAETQFLRESMQFRMRRESSSTQLSELDMDVKRATVDDAIAQVRAQLKQTTSSARNVEALALLNEAALKGAKNTEALEAALAKAGVGGAAIRLLLEALRSSRGR